MTDIEPGTMTLVGIRKRYSRRGPWVLRGIDVSATAGTVTAIVGGNGSGKSTLLRIAAGASRPTQGWAVRPKRSTAYVPGRLPAKLSINAETYIAHMARIRGVDPSVAVERTRSLLGQLALTPGAQTPISELSKGNNQKIALTQAFLAPVALLVLDEPFSGLDTEASSVVGELIAQARAAGSIVILSTHELPTPGFADVTWLLDGGRLQAPAYETTDGPATTMRLVLQALDDRASSQDLAEIPGVIAVDYDAATRKVTMRTRSADRVLHRAIESGWSLVSGQPAYDTPDRAGR